jgi:hypothetical protein
MNLVKYFLIFSLLYYFNASASLFPINSGIENSENNVLINDYWYQKARLFNDLMDKKLLFLKPNTNKTAFDIYDNARDIVDSQIKLSTSVTEIHELGLSSSHLDFEYWTGYFWSLQVGLVGGRLADMKFLKQSDWKGKMNYVKTNPAQTYVPKKIHLLSPSEKYELLIGDTENILTSLMWKKGQQTMDEFGQIFSWIGLCDGMAVATINLPMPKKSITLWSIDKKNKIKFYPEDIKALGTLLWKQGNFPLTIVGDRCNDSTPRVNPNGRYSQPECFDTNPGTFHLALANQIGKAKRSFIMDSVASWEIWNYPIVGYDFKYLNPQNLDQSATPTTPTYLPPSEAIIPIGEYTNDKYSQFRSPLAAFVVGVEAQVNILKDRYPQFLDKDGPEHNVSSVETFKYDLELDQKGNIIGGEWYTHEHPDFLWITNKGAMAKGPFDNELQGNWDPKKELFPEAWVEPALRSSRFGIIPSQIVIKLFELSNQEGEGFNPN